MFATIESNTGVLPLIKALAAAQVLQMGDPDWTYKAVDCGNGLGRIDVYDEENELVISGFLP